MHMVLWLSDDKSDCANRNLVTHKTAFASNLHDPTHREYKFIRRTVRFYRAIQILELIICKLVLNINFIVIFDRT